MAIYLKYNEGKIKGDVTESGHKDWIEVQGFRWGVGRGIFTPTGNVNDRESSAPSVSEITITKAQDCATIDLMQEALTGEGVPVQIDLCRTEKGKLEVFLSYTLQNCIISGYNVDGSGERPQEVLTLNFTSILCSVTPSGGDGKKEPTKRVKYDLATAGAA